MNCPPADHRGVMSNACCMYMLPGPMDGSLVHYKLTKGPRVLRQGKEGSILAL